MSRKPRTVGELIDALSAYPRDALVCATWEGVFEPIAITRSRDGVVLVDADRLSYDHSATDVRGALERNIERDDDIALAVTHETCSGCSECEPGHDADDDATAAGAP